MLRREQRSPRKYLTRKTIRTPQKKEKTQTKLKNKENLSKKDEKRLIKSLKSQKHKYFTSKLNDTVKRLKTFSDIPLCTIVQATEEDLKNPIAFFENLWENNKPSTGIIKIVPPKSWLNQNMKTFSDSYFKRFLESKTKLQIRSQKLNKLYLAKRFKSKKLQTFSEYMKQSLETQNNLYPHGKDNSDIMKIEEDYWKFCFNINCDLEVKYASDIPLSKFLDTKDLKEVYQTYENQSLWNLLTLNKNSNSLFQFIGQEKKNQISGITLPWLYFGMLFSTFCWHTEDLYLYSINFNHFGAAKIWYGIPHNQKEKMDKFIKEKYYQTLLKEPDLVHHLTVFINPLELIENGIEVYKAIQNPGEIILTLPKGYHTGFSTGFNIGEAVNFSTVKWLEFGNSAREDYKKTETKMPVFSLEWLLMNNFENFEKTRIDNLADKNKFKGYLDHYIKEELKVRKNVESIDIKKKSIIFIDKQESYDKYECDMCTSYGFFSFYKCSNCKYEACTNHFPFCRCQKQEGDYIVYYRYDNSELNKVLKEKVEK